MDSAHGSSAGLGVPPATGVLASTSHGKPPKDPSYPPPFGVCRWYDMPNELKDMVFELAYGPYGRFKPLTRIEWDRTEKERRREELRNFKPRVFPRIFIVQFMVDREWLSLALQLFFKRTTFQLDSASEIFSFSKACSVYTAQPSQRGTSRREAKMLPSIKLDRSSASAFIISISQRWWTDNCADAYLGIYPALKRICLQLDKYHFYHVERPITEQQWFEQDFLEHEEASKMLLACSHFSVSVEPIYRDHEDNTAIAMYAHNLATLNNMLRSRPVLQQIPAPVTMRSGSPVGDVLPAVQASDHILSGPPTSTSGVTQWVTAPQMSAMPPMTSSSNPVRDVDIPHTEEDFAQLIFKRGPDVFKWARDVLERVRR